MKNNFWSGVLIGLIPPLIAFLLTNYTTLQTYYFLEKSIAIYVIAAVINLLIMRFAFRGGKDNLAKGILLITFIAMLLLVYATGLKV